MGWGKEEQEQGKKEKWQEEYGAHDEEEEVDFI